jgi:hypothetical protein
VVAERAKVKGGRDKLEEKESEPGDIVSQIQDKARENSIIAWAIIVIRRSTLVKYRVTLTAEERAQLHHSVSAGKAAARKLGHARILLLNEPADR